MILSILDLLIYKFVKLQQHTMMSSVVNMGGTGGNTPNMSVGTAGPATPSPMTPMTPHSADPGIVPQLQ